MVLSCSSELVLFDGGGDLGCQLLHLGGFHFDVVAEIKVAGIVERHQVNVGMGDVDSYDSDTDFDAGTYLFEAFGHLAAETVQGDKQVVVEVEYVVNLFLGDAQDVSFDHWIDIEKCQTFVGFGDFVAGYLACHYA